MDLDFNYKVSVKFIKIILIIFEMYYFGFVFIIKVKSLMFRKDFKLLKI